MTLELSRAELKAIVDREYHEVFPTQKAALRGMQIILTQAESDAKLAAKTALAALDRLGEA